MIAAGLDATGDPPSVESLCVCPGDDALCPMHREATVGSHNDGSAPATCTLRSTCTPLESAILSLQIGAAVLPDGVTLDRDIAGVAVDVLTPVSIARPTLPDLQPPRA